MLMFFFSFFFARSSDQRVGHRLGFLTRIDKNTGNYIVAIIGQHTVQVSGPHDSSWYGVKPALELKANNAPTHEYHYKFQVPAQYEVPSVHNIQKNVSVGVIELIFTKKKQKKTT